MFGEVPTEVKRLPPLLVCSKGNERRHTNNGVKIPIFKTPNLYKIVNYHISNTPPITPPQAKTLLSHQPVHALL
jgi:hypothetical protein